MTIGSAISAVLSHLTVSLMVAGLLICGVVFRQHPNGTSSCKEAWSKPEKIEFGFRAVRLRNGP